MQIAASRVSSPPPISPELDPIPHAFASTTIPAWTASRIPIAEAMRHSVNLSTGPIRVGRRTTAMRKLIAKPTPELANLDQRIFGPAALGAYLQSKGLQKGARVALMMPNVLQYPVATAGMRPWTALKP